MNMILDKYNFVEIYNKTSEIPDEYKSKIMNLYSNIELNKIDLILKFYKQADMDFEFEHILFVVKSNTFITYYLVIIKDTKTIPLISYIKYENGNESIHKSYTYRKQINNNPEVLSLTKPEYKALCEKLYE